VRKRPIVAGDRLTFYVGQRTKACRKLGEGTCCRVRPLTIKETVWPPNGRIVLVDDYDLRDGEVAALARADGFASEGEFFDFFEKRYRLPFRGVLIQWGPWFTDFAVEAALIYALKQRARAEEAEWLFEQARNLYPELEDWQEVWLEEWRS